MNAPPVPVVSSLTASLRGGGLARELTAADGFALVAGCVIGSGIFLVPGSIAMHVRSLPWVMAVWVVGGLLSLFGALSLAEMGSMFPGAGGLYVYLREAYGKPLAFLYGWALFIIIHTGSLATLAAGFALYLSQLVPLSPTGMKLVAAACVLVLTAVNLLRLRQAKRVQNVGIAAKLLGLAILGGFLFWHTRPAVLAANWKTHAGLPLLGFGVALVAVLWAYEGWHVVSFTAAEFRDPQRDLPRSLIWGTATIMAVYLTLNLAYYAVLPAADVAGTPSTAAAAVLHVGAGRVLQLVSLLILTSMVVSMNGLILTGPRVYYAMARDGVFFPALAKTTTGGVPMPAILLQGVWGTVLALSGNFEQLFTWVVFVGWIFYGLAVAGVIVLRLRKPAQPRPFRAPAYPFAPLLFVAASAMIVLAAVASAPLHALAGFAAVAIGWPVYMVFRARHSCRNACRPGE